MKTVDAVSAFVLLVLCLSFLVFELCLSVAERGRPVDEGLAAKQLRWEAKYRAGLVAEVNIPKEEAR